MRIGSVAAVVLAAMLVGCAAPAKVLPEGYAGPKATLQDSTYQETGSKGRVFAAVEIDGQRVASAFEATRRASQGRGFSLSMEDASRDVAAGKPMRVVLRASHVTAAPIHEIALRAAGEFHSVEGEVQWTPRPDTAYVVRGTLQPSGNAVWIEERDAKIRVAGPVTDRGTR